MQTVVYDEGTRFASINQSKVLVCFYAKTMKSSMLMHLKVACLNPRLGSGGVYHGRAILPYFATVDIMIACMVRLVFKVLYFIEKILGLYLSDV